MIGGFNRTEAIQIEKRLEKIVADVTFRFPLQAALIADRLGLRRWREIAAGPTVDRAMIPKAIATGGGEVGGVGNGGFAVRRGRQRRERVEGEECWLRKGLAAKARGNRKRRRRLGNRRRSVGSTHGWDSRRGEENVGT